MRFCHFEALRPVCPACRRSGLSSRLVLIPGETRRGDEIEGGLIGCEACGARYPIVDGLPVLVPDPARFVADNFFYLTLRDDLPPLVAAFLAETAGPGNTLDIVRQHLSSYGWDHWADLDPDEPAESLAAPAGVARLLETGLAPIGDALPPGPVLDIGCGAGRSTALLSERTGRMVLGIDLSVPLARLARRAVVDGRVVYDRRRIGLAFDRRDFPVPAREGADIWICDALALPFEPDAFALLFGLNLLDCLSDPRAGLAEFGRVVAPAGLACLATPFDWSPAATPVAHWLGGRSAAGAAGGRGEAALHALLSDGPEAAGPLRACRPAAEAEWTVRLHERAAMRYRTHMVWASKPSDAPSDAAAPDGRRA